MCTDIPCTLHTPDYYHSMVIIWSMRYQYNDYYATSPRRTEEGAECCPFCIVTFATTNSEDKTSLDTDVKNTSTREKES